MTVLMYAAADREADPEEAEAAQPDKQVREKMTFKKQGNNH